MTIADINLRGIKQIAGRNSSTGDPELIESTNGAAHVTNPSIQNTPAAVTLASGSNTVIATIDVKNVSRLGVQISVAVRALDAFIISGRFHASGSYQTLYSAAADYTTPVGLLVGTSGDLTAITAGASGWFMMDVHGLDSIQLSASCVTDNTGTATVYATGA